jgi:hypothetical protein
VPPGFFIRALKNAFFPLAFTLPPGYNGAMKLRTKDIRKLVLDKMKEKFKAGLLNSSQMARAYKVKFPEEITLIGTSLKVLKNEKEDALTGIIYLAPSSESVSYGGHNICPWASKGCANACLGIRSARLRMTSGRNSKAWKTLLFVYRRDIFKSFLINEIRNLVVRAGKKNMKPSMRLNGTSDILFEAIAPELFSMFPEVQFYDYTKIENRFYAKLPQNYYLTFSRSENNEDSCKRILAKGFNVSVVFEDLQKALKIGHSGYKVINGDLTDFRPSDEKGVIVGLSIKGNAKDDSGFIVKNVSNEV